MQELRETQLIGPDPQMIPHTRVLFLNWKEHWNQFKTFKEIMSIKISPELILIYVLCEPNQPSQREKHVISSLLFSICILLRCQGPPLYFQWEEGRLDWNNSGLRIHRALGRDEDSGVNSLNSFTPGDIKATTTPKIVGGERIVCKYPWNKEFSASVVWKTKMVLLRGVKTLELDTFFDFIVLGSWFIEKCHNCISVCSRVR